MNNDLSASILESRSFLGFFGTTIHLDIGIPLVACIDEIGFRAILDHEFAHMKFKDTTGSRNSSEFYSCFDFVFDYMPPNETITGTIIYLLLGDLSAIVQEEEMRLSRLAELRADEYSARQQQAEEVARALKAIATNSEYMMREIVTPLEKTILGSSSIPNSAFTQFMTVANELDGINQLEKYWDFALEQTQKKNSSHPSTKERLSALNIDPSHVFAPLNKRVLNQLLPKPLQAKIEAEFETTWQNEMEHLY